MQLEAGVICLFRTSAGPNAGRLVEIVGHLEHNFWEVVALQHIYSLSLGCECPPGTHGEAYGGDLIPLPGLPADECESIEHPIPAEVA